MTKRYAELTGFQRDLLYTILDDETTSGIDVKDRLDRAYEEDINHGRLYPNLDSLVEAGYVNKGKVDNRTNSYALTETGKEVLRERRSWENEYTALG